MRRILFIGHEAERAGAPFVLLHLLRWIKENCPEWEIEMLLLRDGDLRESFESVATIHVVSPGHLPDIVNRGLRFARRRLGLRKKFKPSDLPPLRKNYDLVVGNTVASMEYLHHFKKRGLTTVCWLHEMRSVIISFFPEPGRFFELSQSVDCFIVASNAVERDLREFGASNRAELVYEFSELKPIDKSRAHAVRRSLNIPEDAFVVGGCGTVSSRKGTDLFVRIAARLLSPLEDIHFLWVGGRSGTSTVEFDAALAEIGPAGRNRVHITGSQKDPENYFANMDVFALASREDPFPLVCLEAASLSLPIICFEGAGGMPEFVSDGAGAVVPFGDLDAFADQIRMYYHDRARLSSAGEAACRKVKNELSIESSCRKITDLLLQLAS